MTFIENIINHNKIHISKMKTRSQTRTEITPDLSQISELEKMKPIYEVNIDFDDASAAWYQNKKRMPNAMCKYICVGKTKNGNACCKTPLAHLNYCSTHVIQNK